MTDDLAKRSADIHWPAVSPTEADLFSHNEKNVRIRGAGTGLDESSVFTWTTFGLPIESKVYEFVPFTRISRLGSVPGATPSFYHTWLLTPTDNQCHVATDEVGFGADAKRLRESDEGLVCSSKEGN